MTMTKNTDKNTDQHPQPTTNESNEANAQGVMFMVEEIQKVL